MLTDLILAATVMKILSFCYANHCQFKLTADENVLFAPLTPFTLNCRPQFDFDHDLCGDNEIPFLWTIDNRTIEPKEGKIKFVDFLQTLIVFNGSETDQGHYKCRTIYKNHKKFFVQLTGLSMMQENLLPNAFPNDPAEEVKGRIYWLPEMLLRQNKQIVLANERDHITLHGAYYVSAIETMISVFDVQWYSQRNGIRENLKEKATNFNSSCQNLDFLPRNVSGFCHSSQITLIDLSITNQGFYTIAATLILKDGRRHNLNFTYELRINFAPIVDKNIKPELYPQIIFNKDSRVCTKDKYEWSCNVTPKETYVTFISKINSNSNYTLLAESKIRRINISDEMEETKEAIVVEDSQSNYLIKSLKHKDAGVYECRAIKVEDIHNEQWDRPELKKVMNLTVQDCFEKQDSSVTSWIAGAAVISSAFIPIFAIFAYCIHNKYSNNYLVKTVIVQHPNKLYVPHDKCFPLILPDVSIKTTRRQKNSSEDSLLQKKHFNRSSSIPFSQKISKYFRKSFIFNYRHVDLSGSNPDSPTGALSNTATNLMTSNSLTVEAPRPQIILQNDAHTKYILPSNIGWIFSRDSLVIGSKIGEGAFGIVYSALVKSFSDSTAPIEVAIKTLHASFGDEDVINLIRELEMMKIIGRHRHIISLYGACVDNGYPYMVIELAKYGNLRDFLRTRRTQTKPSEMTNMPMALLTVADLLRFSLEIANGMEYLSSRMIIHRDLAARNVLVDQYVEMKIADFGLTRAVDHYYRKTTDGRLPIKWMAPECLLDRIYTIKSDVWSFGIVLWEIFTMGQTPYPTIQSDGMHQALRNGVRNEKPPLASDEMYRLMLTIWNDDPLDRHSFSELVEKLTHIQLLECSVTLKKEARDINNSQFYSTTNV